MNYKQVFYSRKDDVFRVRFDEKTMIVAAEKWDNFLDQHGTNPKPVSRRKSIKNIF